MANTYTTNYSLTKSEVGGDNQNWGTNLHTSLNEIDGQLVNKLDKDVVKGFTSTAIIFTNTGSATGTISAASGDLFQDFEINDKVRVTGATSATNGSDASPSIHTVTSKGSSNSITVSTGLVTASAGDSVDIALVFEPSYSDIGAGEIDGTPIGANSASSGAFSTVSATGQITSTVSTGSAPLVVASTTSVANLKAANADALTNARTITLSGDCTSDSVAFDGSGNITLTTSVSGKVLFKGTINSTSLPAGTAPADKTWIAYGSGEHSTKTGADYGTTNSYYQSNINTETPTIRPFAESGGSYPPIANRYSATSYGYGDCIAIKSDEATEWTTVLPSNISTVKWSHYIQIDNA